MLLRARSAPAGVIVILVYGFAILALVGLLTPLIVEQAVNSPAPVTPIGVVWMLLLAYLIFTLTLVLQRKQAAYALSFGLATLTIPLIPLMFLFAGVPGLVFAVALAAVVFGSLRRRRVREWFSEP